ncbi:MAG: PAS domain S-box protein [Candidatus Zhuqueibacterota bacterium]
MTHRTKKTGDHMPDLEQLQSRISELELRLAHYEKTEPMLPSDDVLFRTITEQIDAAVILIENGKIVYTNPQIEKMVGYSSEEMLHRSFLDFIAGDEKEISATLYEQRMKDRDYSGKFERSLLHKNGSTIMAEISAKVIPVNGRMVSLISFYDITSRKQNEQVLLESQFILNEAQEVANMGSFVWNLESDRLDWSENMLKIAGLNHENFIGALQPTIQSLVHPEDRARVAKEIADMLRQKQSRPMTFRILRPDASERVLRSYSRFYFDENGEVKKCIGIHFDITEQEQNKARLSRQESILHTLVNAPFDTMALMEKDGTLLSINEKGAERLHSTPEQLIGKNIYELFSQELNQSRRGYVDQVFRTARPVSFEDEREGRYLMNSIYPVLDANCQVNQVAVFATDITGRKMAELDLKKSEHLLRTVAANYPAYFSIIEKDFTVGYTAGREFAKQNLNPADFIGRTLEQVFSEQAPFVTERYKEAFAGEEVTFELFINQQYQLYHVVPLKEDSGAIERIMTVVENITERKQAEELLKANEERYRFLAENTADIVWMTDLNFNVNFISPSIEKVLGFTPEERMQQSVGQMMTPESLQAVMTKFADETRLEEAGEATYDHLITIEVEYYHKNGSTVWMENCVKALRDADGKLIGIGGSSRDISERKRAEKVLRESEEKYRMLVERSLQGVVIAQANPVRLRFASTPMEIISGYSTDELIQFDAVKLSRLIHPEDREVFFSNFKKRLEGQEIPARAQYRINHKYGDIRWVEIYSTRIEYEGQPATQTVFLDITERKIAEEELRFSEEKYRRIVETANEGIWMMDKNYCTSYVNEKMAQILGYSVQEMISSPIRLYIFPADLPDQEQTLKRRVLGESAQYERRFLHKDGSIRWLYVSATPLKDERGQFAGSFAMFTDITEIKKTEQELRDKQSELEEILRALPDGLVYTDVDRKIAKVNPAFERMFGYRAEEVLGKKTEMIYANKDEFTLQGLIRFNVNVEGLYDPYEISYVRKDGSIFPSETVGTPVHGADGKPLGFLGLVRDITERKLAEKRMQDHANELQWLFKSMINAFVIFESVFDADGRFISYRFVYINDAYERITSVKNEDVKGKTVHDVWPETEPAWIENYGYVAVTGVSKTFDLYHGPTGKLYHCNVYRPWDSPDRFCVIFEDITEREKSERTLRESEERYRVMFETAHDAIFVADPQSGTLLDLNIKAEKLTGYTREELIGKHQSFLHPKERKQLTRDTFHQATRERGTIFTEVEVLTKDGKLIPIEVSSGGTVTIGGRDVHFGIFRDITRRKKAEQELRESEQRFRSLYENATVGLYQTTPEGKILLANSAIVKMLGYTSIADLSRRNLNKAGYDPQHPRESFIKRVEEKGEIIGFESAWVAKSGKVIYVRESARAIRDESGKTLYYEGTVEDITERRKAEIALIQSEGRYRELFDEAPVGYHEIDARGCIRQVNSTELEMLGYSKEEMVGTFIWKFIAEPEARASVLKKVKGQLAPGKGYERTFIRKDGSRFSALVEDRLLQNEQGENAGMRATIQDITQLKRVQNELRSHLEFFKILIDTMPNPIFYKDVQGRYLGCNEAFASEILGRKKEEIIGKTIREIPDTIPDDVAEIYHERDMELLKNPGRQIYETNVLTASGDKKDFILSKATYNDLNGRVAGMVGVMVNITETKKLQVQLQQSLKMEAIGRLAGGIAHDFNNLLTAILGNAEFALDRLSQNNPMRDELNEIRKAGNRAAALTQQLLAFSRKQPLKRKVTNLNHVVTNIKKMIQRIIGEDIHLVTSLDESLSSCYVDPSQVEQVIMNLSVNARDAMVSGGTLSIGTENITLDAIKSDKNKMVKAVSLVIQDNGAGMDKETLARIFDPFFTTKGPGGGTGLGLSVVQGIVEQHEGWIQVDSEVGVGTTFRVCFPGISAKVEAEMVEPVAIKAYQGKSERILLVEDEEDVRNFISKILTWYNYAVVSAEDATRALQIFEKENGEFDLVLSDVVLPDKSGHDLVRHLLKIKPGLRVLLSSGYMDEKGDWERIQAHGLPFLQKPYDLFELLDTIKKVLSDAL